MEERWCGMKKNDWILAAAIFFVAVLTIGLQLLKTTDEYSEVEIQVNGELYGRYRLEQDQEIDVTYVWTTTGVNLRSEIGRAHV